jgi:signal transduction histidine kinase
MTICGTMLARYQYSGALLLFFSGVAAAWLILRIFNTTNQLVAEFVNALRNNDTAIRIPVKYKNKSLIELLESLNGLISHFQQFKRQSETNAQYYKALIRHSATGLMVLNGDNIEIINDTACKYAGITAESTNSNLLKIKNPLFYEAVCKLKPGEVITYKHIMGKEFHLLLFRAAALRVNEKMVKLVSIQDIRNELESKELDSYKKLISVMTHEIMNLVSPLTSVSKALQELYLKNGNHITESDVDEMMIKSTINGLNVIGDQSNGLLNFIDHYRRISRIPQPIIERFSSDEWIEQLNIVYGSMMKENNIEFTIQCDKLLRFIEADKNLLNQLMINLVRNAVEALREQPLDKRIMLELIQLSQNRVRITITNNGPYIPPEIQEKIFVPFFTTKKEGSGVGLSICQEIMKLHKGSLSVISNYGGMTSFIAEF